MKGEGDNLLGILDFAQRAPKRRKPAESLTKCANISI
jgi:hypothetical protein